ncbi:MAG: transcription-repair coupling factor [Elusimicrobiota bacterium]
MNSAGSYFLLSLIQQAAWPVVVAAGDEEKAWDLAENFSSLQEYFYPQSKKEVLFFPSIEQEQIVVLDKLARQTVPLIFIAKDLLEQEVYGKEDFIRRSLTLQNGEKKGYSRLFDALQNGEMERVESVVEPGEFSLRGEVVDFWSVQEENPCRLTFNGEEIEKIALFDPLTQRSLNPMEKVTLLPAKNGQGGSFASYLPKDSRFYLFDSEELPPAYRHFAIFGSWGGDSYRYQSVLGWNNNFAAFVRDLQEWSEAGFRRIIFVHNLGEKERLQELLAEESISLDELTITLGNLDSSFISVEEKLIVLASDDIFNRHRVRRYWPKFKGGGSIESLQELAEGDYVVHERYGISRYLGLERIKTENKAGDYLTLEFKGGDRLYVPVTDFRLAQKYLGPHGHNPQLSSLDVAQWERTKSRVKKAVQEMAEELLRVEALRQSQAGFGFSPDNHYEQEFSNSFLYEETPDQARAIAEVKKDMQSPKPMDRLVCGDVGYGKTEVAMRAAFKCVLSGKQAALLVPTTLLAEQHYQNFRERYAEYPVTIKMLSRFIGKSEQKEIIDQLSKGTVDIVIGTHQLLQPKISFHDLGLVIIDEEHRFGVAQKEKLKKFRATVDLLSLTATPIPRTLSMSLGGIKDMSVIETPPVGRLPIATWVGEDDEKIIRNAVRAEIYRGGQVFYVHNRIETIHTRLSRLESIIPQARFAVIHGQLPAKQIEEVMENFLHKKYDVLVSTTIIESGLDIQQVNTLLVDEAENFGLAQLYQLRGRIGRGQRRAYCYLFYTSAQSLTPEARKRLKALQEFASLGSGFRLALRDLEIRGTGNILGAQQHGFMSEIGYELYCRLLAEEIRQLKGEKIDQIIEPEISLDLEAYWPVEYIPAPAARIAFYKRLLSVKNIFELTDLKKELDERFGKLPGPAQTLFEIGEIRLWIKELKIAEIKQIKEQLAVVFSDEVSLPAEIIVQLPKIYPSLKFIPGDKFQLTLNFPDRENLLPFIKNFLSKLG